MREAIPVRLARIEEGQAHLHSKVDDIKKMLEPIMIRLEDHHLTLADVKRDRKWLVGIGGIVGGVVASVTKFFSH